MPFKNFSIWRGRLPHWRADDVTYYVTFRHRRALDVEERRLLFGALSKPDGRKWELLILCVLPEATELMFRVQRNEEGRPYELSQILERAKARAGKEIIKRTGERFAPFYGESYDRIVRDEAEQEERWRAILESPVKAELVQDPSEHEAMYVAASNPQ